jgi:glycosyltransferase involved in cell wall biosynthesis
MSLWRKLAKACTLMDEGGPGLVARHVRASWAAHAHEMPAPQKDWRVHNFRYVADGAAGGGNPRPNFARVHDPRKLVINWLIPTFEVGSGGHMTIFRMIKYLEQFGHENRLYLLFGHPDIHDVKALKARINEHFVPLDAPLYVDKDGMADCDVAMATSWNSVYPLCQVTNTLMKAYFVQDFEPHFYAHGAEWYFAEATYRLGFKHLTAGPWLAKKLQGEYGADATPFHLSFDRHRYRPLEVARQDDKFRVLYYVRPVTPRRCFELGALALGELYKRLGDKLEVITIGWDVDQFALAFPSTNLGVVAQDDLPALYAGVDVGLVHSSTNCSLLPLEIMACRTAVVDLDVPNVEGTLIHQENAYLASPTPHGIADALEYLYRHPAERQALAERGYQFAQRQPTWEDAARVVEGALLRELSAVPART